MKVKRGKTVERFIGCTLRQLPESQMIEAAEVAIAINPANRPPAWRITELLTTSMVCVEPAALPVDPPARLAVLTSKYWGAGGVRLTVGFPFDSTPADLKARIVAHMNAWAKWANVTFSLTATDPQVRITRNGDGYWSYLGTDVLSIPRNQPTMCLQGFTMNTSEGEFKRVVRHETGHTLGFPHEHMRASIIDRIDRNKAIDYFRRTQGWSAQVTVQQVLTPLSESSVMGTPNADQDSVMCYQLPGSITKDGRPIPGGLDINELDGTFAGKLYPKPAPPAPPAASGSRVTIFVGDGTATVEKVEKV